MWRQRRGQGRNRDGVPSPPVQTPCALFYHHSRAGEGSLLKSSLRSLPVRILGPGKSAMTVHKRIALAATARMRRISSAWHPQGTVNKVESLHTHPPFPQCCKEVFRTEDRSYVHTILVF